jgi:UDP-N-acetylglucosamine/UDP-N-acetylgalactosamine diphosphorylase
MDIEKRYQKARKLLGAHDQSHLLAFWGELDDGQKASLLDQIEELDLAMVEKWVCEYVKKDAPLSVPSHLEPAPAYPAAPTTAAMEKKYEKAREKGRQLISNGLVGALLVAGGQGTRLGYDGPKGNYPISPVKGKTLFKLFAEQIAAASKRYRVTLPWYIMTSPLNRQATEEIFERNEWFGLDRKSILIFQQGTMPNFGFDGKILMESKWTLSQSPNGHGGTIKAVVDSNALADMCERGVQYLSYFQVDNPLINIFDPLFIGLHVAEGAEISSKALVKAEPREKVGNFCLADGKVTVIEYIDLPDELAEARNPDGSLKFRWGSIAIHIIDVKFIEKLCGGERSLPFHKAIKKIPHINAKGRRVEPEEPNGIKLEMFIFDALPLAKKSVILETVRSEEFAPVKNASGVDSAEVAKAMMTARAAAWLEKAAIKVPRKADGSVNAVIDMSPSFALEPSEVKARVHKIKKIAAGDKVYLE